jgi:hypothetical protein
MERMSAAAMTLCLLVLPVLAYGEPVQSAATDIPPVAQPLIREGGFALKLAQALYLGLPGTEPEAEGMLVKAGIAPEKGWIADYPLTPDTISELRSLVGASADANRLPMERAAALDAFEGLIAELGLSVARDPAAEKAGDAPAAGAPDYLGPSIISNYYYNVGPPVVTYYRPPWDYYYLYWWVPYPFRYSGYFFPGFFILHDFNRVFIVKGREVVVSNRFYDRKYRRYSTLRPEKRHGRHRGGVSYRAWRGRGPGEGFRTFGGEKGARSILDRSVQGGRAHGGRNPSRFRVERNATRGTGSGKGTLTSRGMNRGRAAAVHRDSPWRERATSFGGRRGTTQHRPEGPGIRHGAGQARRGVLDRDTFRPRRSGPERSLNRKRGDRSAGSFRGDSSKGGRALHRGSGFGRPGNRSLSRGSAGRGRGAGFSARGGIRGGGCRGRC